MAFLPFARQRMETFSDLAPLGNYLVSGMLSISAEDLKSSVMNEDQLLEVLQPNVRGYLKAIARAVGGCHVKHALRPARIHRKKFVFFRFECVYTRGHA